MKITNEKDYILVEPSEGIDFWEIIEGIGKLFTMDGFQAALAKEYTNIVKDFPMKTKVFFNMESAEEWKKNIGTITNRNYY